MPETVHPIPHHILPQSTAKDHRGAVVPQGVPVRTHHRYDVRQRLQSIRVQRCVPTCGSQAQHLPVFRGGISGEAIAGGTPQGGCSRKNLNSRMLQGNTFRVLPLQVPCPFSSAACGYEILQMERPHPPGEAFFFFLLRSEYQAEQSKSANIFGRKRRLSTVKRG